MNSFQSKLFVSRVLNILSICIIALFFVSMAYAATPNPGHPWTDLGNGMWQVANTQTAPRTFTFPDSDATVLTTGGIPTSGTIPYGNATGILATTSAGTAGFVLAYFNNVPTWTATTTFSNPLLYSAGNVTCQTATGSIPGCVSATDWTTFNNKQGALVAPGTAGNVLMSNGTTWVSAATSSPGAFIGKQILTSGTTYTPTAGTNSILLQMVGGGAGGSGATGSAATASMAGGGGAGGYVEKRFSGIAAAGSYTIAIGAAGSAGVAANGAGGLGGNTTFACPLSCLGGALIITANGAPATPATIAAGTTILASLGGAGAAVSTNGDLNTGGSPGEEGIRFSGTTGFSGNGASSVIGGGGIGRNTAGIGTNAANYGSGGGGALSISTTGVAGGAGSAGVIIVWEYK